LESERDEGRGKAAGKRRNLVSFILLVDMLAVLIPATVIFALGRMSLEDFLFLAGVTFILAVIVFALLKLQHG